MKHDFTEEGLDPEGFKAKQATRVMALEIAKLSDRLWSRKHQHLRHSWMELAGERAPSFHALLKENALGPEARFIGVDDKESVIRGCQEYYKDHSNAEWYCGSLAPAIRPLQAFPDVGVLVFDSEYSAKGKPIRNDVKVLARFAQRQYEALGGFLLVINVVANPRDVQEEDIQAYLRMLSRETGVEVSREAPHTYVSSQVPMVWTALRFGF